MRRVDIVSKRNWSLTDAAKLAAGSVFGEAFCWVGFFLAAWGARYSIYIGLAVFICWALILVLIVRRELKLDLKALDDPNDNPRANRLIANRRERGSFDAQTALLGALLVLMFALAAYLHERWTVVAYIAGVIFVISALLLVRRALKLIRSISI
jgi:hypothetical protein